MISEVISNYYIRYLVEGARFLPTDIDIFEVAFTAMAASWRTCYASEYFFY